MLFIWNGRVTISGNRKKNIPTKGQRNVGEMMVKVLELFLSLQIEV